MIARSLAAKVWLIGLLIFVLIAASRLMWLSLFGAELPFWDQWDAEGWLLYRAFELNTLEWSQLVAAHNEHRILWPRLSSLAIFMANGHEWNNLVSATFASLVFAAVIAGCAAWFGRALALREGVILGALLILCTSLPVGWENLVFGFQIAFFWMLLFTFLTLGLAARSNSAVGFVGMSVAAIAGLFTTASAVLAVPTAALVVVQRWRLGQIGHRRALAAVLALAVITAIGFLLIPATPQHSGLRSQGVSELFQVLFNALAWPFDSYPLAGWLLWLPLLLWIPDLVAARPLTTRQLFAMAVSGWILLQCVAIAYARGNGMDIVPARYLDLLMFAPICNAFLLLERLRRYEGRRQRLVSSFAAAYLALACAGLLSAGFNAVGALGERQSFSTIQTANVERYLRDGDAAALDGKPYLHIPYPNAARLKMMLDDPGIRAMLPASIRPAQASGATAAAPTLSRMVAFALEHAGLLLALIWLGITSVLFQIWLRRPAMAEERSVTGKSNA